MHPNVFFMRVCLFFDNYYSRGRIFHEFSTTNNTFNLNDYCTQLPTIPTSCSFRSLSLSLSLTRSSFLVVVEHHHLCVILWYNLIMHKKINLMSQYVRLTSPLPHFPSSSLNYSAISPSSAPFTALSFTTPSTGTSAIFATSTFTLSF